MFGGLHGEVPTNDVFMLRLRLKQNEWSRQDCSAGEDDIPPPPRWRHTASPISPSEFLIFGGCGVEYDQRLNDVWILNVVSLTWRRALPEYCTYTVGDHIPCEDCPKDCPCPRSGHSACVIGKKFYIFGGEGGWHFRRDDLSDLKVLDLSTWTWKEVSCS